MRVNIGDGSRGRQRNGLEGSEASVEILQRRDVVAARNNNLTATNNSLAACQCHSGGASLLGDGGSFLSREAGSSWRSCLFHPSRIAEPR